MLLEIYEQIVVHNVSEGGASENIIVTEEVVSVEVVQTDIGPQGKAGDSGIVPIAAIFPINPEDGQLFYNTADTTLYIWNGANWATIGSVAVVTFRLLNEDRSWLLTEDGLELIRE